ncbi:MAG: hypothetical protein AAGH65_12925 [Pseudomonadota bacterium]
MRFQLKSEQAPQSGQALELTQGRATVINALPSSSSARLGIANDLYAGLIVMPASQTVPAEYTDSGSKWRFESLHDRASAEPE